MTTADPSASQPEWDDLPVRRDAFASDQSDPRSRPAASAPCTGRPPDRVTSRERGDAVVSGVVRSPSLRSESLGPQGPVAQILSLTLLVYADDGDRTEFVAVELRGLSLSGPIPTDGDKVQARGHYTGDGVLQADAIYLTDANAVVQAGGRRTLKAMRAATKVATVIAIVGALCISLFILNETGRNPLAPKVTVPAVRMGEGLPAVDSRLRDAGLHTRWLNEESSEVPFGTVIRISPESGTEVRENTTVTIYSNSRLR